MALDPSSSARYRPEINWIQIVYNEIASVTNAMKRNQRWNRSSHQGSTFANELLAPNILFKSGDTSNNSGVNHLKDFLSTASNRTAGSQGAPIINQIENKLLNGFTKLKQKLNSISNLRDLDPSNLLFPFLEVIKSGDTTGNITGAALTSIQDFINYRILDPHHPDVAVAVVSMTHAVTRCKFEATDIASDEIVLTNILRLLTTIAISDIGKKCISDKGICEMVEVAFGMHFQARISELLRKAAEQTLLVLTQTLFERLVVITREAEHRETMKHTITLKVKNSRTDTSADSLKGVNNDFDSKNSPIRRVTVNNNVKSFGIPAILEFTRVIITLIDPKDHRHTDTLHRALALRLATRALEVGGQSLAKWVEAGFLVEKELEKTPHKERGDLHDHINAEMMIITEQPAAVVSVGANGANYAEISGPRLASSEHLAEDYEEEKAGKTEKKKIEVLQTNVAATPPRSTIGSSGQSTNQAADDKEKEFEESDFQNLAININHMIIQDLTRHLFHLLLAQNTTNLNPPSWSGLNTISLVLRTISTLFSAMREHMIPQQQWFIQHLMKSCNSGVTIWGIEEWMTKNTGSTESLESANRSIDHSRQPIPVLVSEVRELYLEALLQLCRNDTIYNELYVYHDTNIYDKNHSFEDLINFFAKFTFPDTSPGGYVTNVSHQALAFDGILIFLRCLTDRRLLSLPVPKGLGLNDDDSYLPEKLISNTTRKEIFLAGAEIFNKSSKKGIKYFQEHEFLPKLLTPKALAKFMYDSANLSKSVIGEYIAKRDEVNIETLKEFVNLFIFEGRRIDEAMRQFLEKFRIPGEAQQIERVLDAFSKRYFKTISDDPDREIKTEDDTGVLAFSIIMLNTDQHNPQVRKRMTFEDYKRNVRGLNSGTDFAPDYLQSIYTAIQQNEIVLAEERGGDLGFNYEWKELMKRIENLAHFSPRDSNSYDKDLFLSVSVPLLSAVFYVFENMDDSALFEKSLVAIQEAVLIAVRYNLSEIFDFIIVSLLRISGLSKSSRALPQELDFALSGDMAIEREKAKPDRWLIEFGQNYKCQVAAVLGFNILKDFPDTPSSSWTSVVACLSNLFLHQCIPATLLFSEHFCKGKITTPRLLVTKLNSEESPRKEQGLFSSFAQFLSLGSSEYEEEQGNPQNIICQTMAMEAISFCRMDDFLEETRYMHESSVIKLLKALIDASFSVSEKIADKNDEETIQINRFSLQSVFFIEIIFKIVLRNRDRLSNIWVSIADHLKRIIMGGTPVVLIERATTNILRLLLRLTHVTELQSDVFDPLNNILNLKSEIISSFVEHLTAGFLAVAKTDMSILSKTPARWTVLFRIISIAATHHIASSYSFELICLITSGHPHSPLTADHFGDCVDLLLSFSGVLGPLPNIISASPGRKETKNGVSLALDRALKAIEKLYNLHLIIPKLIDDPETQSKRFWFEFWLPVLSGLGQQCSHPSVDIRHLAMSYLQSLLLSDELSRAADQNNELQHRIDCFDIVLFPMFEELGILDTSSDTSGGSETLARACVLITKTFLHFTPKLIESKEYIRIWTKILDLFSLVQQKASQENGFAMEGIQESLKNALHVLMADNIIKEPAVNEKVATDVWDITWDKIQKIFPNLKDELVSAK